MNDSYTFGGGVHCHFGIWPCDSNLDVAHFCARFEDQRSSRRSSSRSTVVPSELEAQFSCGCGDYWQRPVLVFVREVRQHGKRIVELLQITVRLARLYQSDGFITNSGQSLINGSAEVSFPVADRELDEGWPLGARVGAMKDKLPRDVIERATKVLDRVPENDREGLWWSFVTTVNVYDRPCEIVFYTSSEGDIGMELVEADEFALESFGVELGTGEEQT